MLANDLDKLSIPAHQEAFCCPTISYCNTGNKDVLRSEYFQLLVAESPHAALGAYL